MKLFPYTLLFVGGIVSAALCPVHGASTDTAPSPGSRAPEAAEQKRRHQVGIDVGSDTDPDLLAPVAPVGLDRLFEWDYRFVVREDRVGVNAHYRKTVLFQKLTFSYRQRMDFPTRAGLGRTRDDVYDSLSQKIPAKDAAGYVVGSALVFNNYWGVSFTHDELVKTALGNHYHVQVTVLGVGYSPWGMKQIGNWGLSIDPSVSFEKFHRLEPAPNTRYESIGFSVGPSFYYGLDRVRLFGLGKSVKLDRLKLYTAVSDSEAGSLAMVTGLNVTAYVTRHLKLSVGTEDVYGPHNGKHAVHLRARASVRLVWSDLHF